VKNLNFKIIDSLALAQMKAAKTTVTTDLSSTDYAQYMSKKKMYSKKHSISNSKGLITKEPYNCPPKYDVNILLYLNYTTHF